MRTGRVAALALIAATAVACGTGGLFPQYEYEEDIYLSLDGTAIVYVNSSVPALDALHGASLDVRSNAPIDRQQIRNLYNTAVTQVRQVSFSRRSNRRFVHVRVDVDDVRRLGEAMPFAWSTYRYERDGDLFAYRQSIGQAANKSVGNVGWTGREIVAFRLHLPSKIAYHNTQPARRGNILVWEQSLDDRLRGAPLVLDARVETQSILYRTLWLFGATLVAVAVAFALVIWWVLGQRPRLAPSEKTRSAL
jgi:hypothetical protein